jgi:hypothetical protein
MSRAMEKNRSGVQLARRGGGRASESAESVKYSFMFPTRLKPLKAKQFRVMIFSR